VDPDQRASERHRVYFGGVASDRYKDASNVAGRDRDAIVRFGLSEIERFWIKRQGGAANHAIQTLVTQHDTMIANRFCSADAAALSLHAAHLEQICEIAVEANAGVELQYFTAVIADADALKRRPPPQERGPNNMQRVFLQNDLAAPRDVWIGQVGRHNSVVVANSRSQQQRLQVADGEFEPGQEARVPMEQAVRLAHGDACVAVIVQHEKGIAPLERLAGTARGTRRSDIEGRLFHRRGRFVW
jgi:hypothetical protein